MQAAAVELAEERIHAALAAALERKLEMAPTDAREIAGHVIDAFAGRPELDDEELPSDLRAIFYTLEGKRLLSFRREEYRNEEGHLRRAFFWRIRWEMIEGVDEEGAASAGSDGAQGSSVYEELPKDAWIRV